MTPAALFEGDMQFRVVRFESRNPLVGILLLLVVLALLAAFVTAGVALAAGAAVIGGGAYVVRRLFGGRQSLGAVRDDARSAIEGREVFPPGAIADGERFTAGDRRLLEAESIEHEER